jgi:predicted ABC-type ATPase
VSATDARTGLADLGDQPSAGIVADLDSRMERLPEGHPSSPRYRADATRAADGRVGDTDEARPLTDAEHVEHVADVKARLADAKAAGLATDVQYVIDVEREIWSDERQDAHDEILDFLYAKASAVPCEHKAIVAGGLAGSGKTTILNDHAGIDTSKYLMINPDIIKVEMARRGLVPQVDGLTPMEATELVHEESSYLAQRLAHRAQADGRNLIWDITMSKAESAAKRIQALRASGYARVDGIFVDIPVDVSVRRADARYRHEHEQYRSGLGLGGRYVPEEMIRAQEDPDWGSKNRGNFEQIKHQFDAWSRYDNALDGRDPVLVEARSAAPDKDVRTSG